MQVFAGQSGAGLDFFVGSTGSGASVTHVFIFLVFVVRVGTLQLGRCLGGTLGDTARFNGCTCISMCAELSLSELGDLPSFLGVAVVFLPPALFFMFMSRRPAASASSVRT